MERLRHNGQPLRRHAPPGHRHRHAGGFRLVVGPDTTTLERRVHDGWQPVIRHDGRPHTYTGRRAEADARADATSASRWTARAPQEG